MKTKETPSYMIRNVQIPRKSPHFMKCRKAVRDLVKKESLTDVVVAFSGGADSLALTAACLAEGLSVTTVCVNHNLQANSSEVAKNASQIALSMGASTSIIDVYVPSTGSMEAEARTLRYQALRKVAQGKKIMVGHTMNDQAETLLLGVMRGKTTGMLEVNDDILRPLLTVRRSDTIGACDELGLEYWSDPQNEDESYQRVFVRKTLIPTIQDKIGGDMISSLSNAAQIAQEDSEFLDSLAEVTYDCNRLQSMHVSIRRRSIVKMLHQNNVRVSTEVISSIDDMVMCWRGQKALQMDGKKIYRVKNMLYIDSI